MVSFLTKGIVIRRFKYVASRFISDEFHGPHELCDTMEKILPPITSQQKRKNIVHSECLISFSTMLPIKIQLRLKKIQSAFNFMPNPKDTNDDDDGKSNDRAQREAEIKKSQDLRQRDIDHNFHKESVWKALQERDEILRRKVDKDTKNDKEDEEK